MLASTALCQNISNETFIEALAADGVILDSLMYAKSGGNNKIFCGAWQGQQVAVKQYCHDEHGCCERLSREFESLSFLNEHAITCVPKALYKNAQHRIAVYEWIEGTSISTVQEAHVELLLGFLMQLKHLSDHKAHAHQLLDAKDACLSLESLIELIERRFKRLESIDAEHAMVKQFVDRDCRALFADLKNKAYQLYADHALDATAHLDKHQQTLSPSDFGFHNAISRQNGDLMFLDFEYFGWDDPVKMLSDFLWHPGQQVSKALKSHFQDTLSHLFSSDSTFHVRMQALFPLYGLVWVLIALNHFIPDAMAKKIQLGVVAKNKKHMVLQQQLILSRSLLAKVKQCMGESVYA